MRPPPGDPLLEDVHDWLDLLSPFGSGADPRWSFEETAEAARADRAAAAFDAL